MSQPPLKPVSAKKTKSNKSERKPDSVNKPVGSVMALDDSKKLPESESKNQLDSALSGSEPEPEPIARLELNPSGKIEPADLFGVPSALKVELANPASTKEYQTVHHHMRVRRSLLSALGAVFFFGGLLLAVQWYGVWQESREGETIQGFVMPDLTSTDEESAVAELSRHGCHISRTYIYSYLHDDGTVVKCSADPGTYIPKGCDITVYICRKSEPEGADQIRLPDCPVLRGNLALVRCVMQDGQMLCTFRNLTEDTLQHISVRFGFLKSDGSPAGDRVYRMDGVELGAGESISRTIALSPCAEVEYRGASCVRHSEAEPAKEDSQ